MNDRNQAPHKRPRRNRRGPYALAFKLTAVVFTAEAAVMWVFGWLKLPEGPVEVLLDAALLIILSVPGIHALVVRPLQQTQSALRESKEWLSTTLKSIGDGVIATDIEGSVRFMNPVAEVLTGWSQDDGIGKRLSEVFVILNERTGQRTENPITRVLAEGVIVALANHTVLISKNGTKRAIDDSGAPLKDKEGRVMGGVLVFRDVTERRRAEEERRRLATAIDQAVEAVVITDLEGTALYVNPAFERITGYTRQETVGQNLRLIKSGKHAPAFYQNLWGTIRRGEVWAGQFINKRKDGALYDEEGTISPVRDEGGKIINFVAVKYDVTDRKRAEEAVRDAQERLLEQRRREKERVDAELEKVRGELVARTRLATIGQVSASVAHELRNPLGAVRNAAYFLKRHGPQSEEKLAKYLGIIDEEVNRADRTIRNLMEMSRPKEPTVQQVDLADIVRETLDMANAPEGVRCRMSLGVDPFLIHVDPSQLRQVLINLLTNAAQAIRGRGEIVVEARHENGYDRIVVRDSGPGVPTEHRGQLFEPLFSTKAKGTGLGLTICRQIIEQHGGVIEFVEADEGGAAFEIRLPSRAAPESSESGEALCLHGKRSEQEHRS